jgi:RTA1 like protein
MRSIREKGVSLPRGTVDKSMQLMLIGMSIMIILLLIRSVYRIVQLSGGWRGKVMAIQWLFGSSPCRLPASPSLLFSYRDADCENRRV